MTEWDKEGNIGKSETIKGFEFFDKILESIEKNIEKN